MKKTLLVAVVAALLFVQMGAANVFAASKEEWQAAKQERQTAEETYHQAQLDYAADKTPENNQKVIDTAKEVLDAALTEAEEWLNWKNADAQASDAPAEIKANISSDVSKNLAKINTLRAEVDGIETRLDVGVVFLKMIGAYVELLADVARNTGAVWVYTGTGLVDKAADYEAQLRTTAEELDNNSDIIAKLDIAKSELDTARSKIDVAEDAYKKVVLPGTPLIKFAEGNGYLRQARTNLLNAQAQLAHAYSLIITAK